MSAEPFDDAGYTDAQNAELDAVADELAAEARLFAERQRRLAGLADRALTAPGNTERFLSMELAGSWRISQLTAARWLDDADRFCTALPLSVRLLEQGALYVHQAKVLLHRTRHCTLPVARAVEAEVLPGATELCPADLGKRIDRAVLRHESAATDPASAEQRHADAAAERRTFHRAEPDGMALVGAVLTAEQSVAWTAAMDALHRRERRADRAAGTTRTADQRRADIFAALPAMVLANTPPDAGGDGSGAGAGGSGAGSGAAGEPAGALVPWTFGPDRLAATVVLNVLVPVSTVLELSREPGTLTGYGPISAAHVRLLRPTAYRRVMVDGHTGQPIAVDDRSTPVDADPDQARAQIQQMLRPDVIVDAEEPQHDPSARLARLIDLRDLHCCGPGCSSSSTHRDHHTPYPLGPTSAGNLGRLSARCHAAKHAGWTLHRHPDGSATWHSPLGRTYHRPAPHPAPPPVNPYTEPTPRRAPPTGTTPWWNTHQTGGDPDHTAPPNPADPNPPDPDAPDPPAGPPGPASAKHEDRPASPPGPAGAGHADEPDDEPPF